MKKIFNDYDFKDTKSSIKLALKSSKDKDLSTWEISRYIFDLNTYYYKYEIVNSIIIAINNGIDPSNIAIMDSSFMLNRQYSKLDIINMKNTEIKLLYFLGLPYSMFPNSNIFELRYIFKAFRRINEILFKYHTGRNSTSLLPSLYTYSKKTNIEDTLENLKDITLKSIKNHKKKSDIENEISKAINNSIVEIEKKQPRLAADLLLSPEKLHTEKQLSENYSIFFHLLSSIQRPVVLVLDDDRNKCRVLCKSQINKKAKDNTTFTLRSVTQNSPIDMIVQSGISIATSFSDAKRKKELHEAELSLIELKKKKIQSEIDIQQIELFSKQIELLKQIADLESNPNYAHISRITIPYLQQQLNFVNDKITSNLQTLNDKFGLETDYNKTEVNILV